jgi:hypothetical protein
MGISEDEVKKLLVTNDDKNPDEMMQYIAD